MPTVTSRALRRALFAMFATAVSVAGLTLPSSAAEPVRDGASQATAAASCWEVKVTNPAAPDGVYWIQTPQLQTPVEICCDQTTSGGGWELIGRGREDWTYNYNGKGTPQDVSSVITGTAAFAPKQLDSTIINGLMGGRRFDSFSDGVRIRRATNTSGRRGSSSTTSATVGPGHSGPVYPSPRQLSARARSATPRHMSSVPTPHTCDSGLMRTPRTVTPAASTSARTALDPPPRPATSIPRCQVATTARLSPRPSSGPNCCRMT